MGHDRRMFLNQVPTQPTPTGAPTDLQLATLGIAALAALGIGTIAAAVLTAVLTKRRERGAWLRTLQAASHENFQSAVSDAVLYVTSGAPDTALHHPHFAGLQEAIDQKPAFDSPVLAAYERLRVVAEPSR
jgi:hypothetical protein